MDRSQSAAALIERLERRILRERRARQQAEDLLEAKSRELYDANRALSGLASDLEHRVHERTRELGAARERAVTLAERDQLTGLPNRMVFANQLESAIQSARSGRGGFALFLVDLDGFKGINDTFGHEAGDIVLQRAASRLVTVLGECVFAARLGGDEFAAILPDLGGPHELCALADRLVAAHRQPVGYRDRLIEGSCSVGIATFPDDADDAAELQRHADLALYKSKAAGRARYTLFDIAMRAEFEDRHSLGIDLRQAIQDGAVRPWYQPIVDGDTRRIVGVEALARWSHPTRGMLSPAAFLGLAEERGLMPDLFASMLRAACVPAKRWLARNSIQYLSINVSPSQFRSGLLAGAVFDLIGEFDYPPDKLTIEITEDLLLFDLDRARVQLEQLSAGGVRIALDDFGIGYSNIAYLRRLPLHAIKLDRFLTADVCIDQRARSVLRAVVDIARALELDLIAEGVEDESQARLLSDLGCKFQQGFYYGRPMSESRLDAGHRQLMPPWSEVA